MYYGCPATLLSAGTPSSDPAPKLTQRTRSQFLEFAQPYYFSNQIYEEVFETGSSVLAEGPATTAGEFGEMPGFKIREASVGKAGFSAILPASFFVENRSNFRPPSALPPAALAGKGTEQDPFQIRSRTDFDAFCNDPTKWAAGVCTKLETDIDLSNMEFDDSVIAPLLGETRWDKRPEFNGIFDGNSKKLIGLKIKPASGAGSGLFREIGESGVVRNLSLVSVQIKSPDNGPRVVVLCEANKGLIKNCRWSGTVEGNYSGSSGFCFNNFKTGRIIECFAGGDGKTKITGGSGGICGNNMGLIERSGSVVEIQGSSLGGLVSQNSGILRECYSGGVITQSAFVGGLCGKNYGEIENCFSRTTIFDSGLNASDPYIGGLVGSQSMGTADGRPLPPPRIRNSVAYGQIQSPVTPGGVVGVIAKEGSPVEGMVEGSFWNTESTGARQSTGGMGLTSAEMKDQAIFEKAGWDFKTVWRMGENGPELRNAANPK